MAADKHHSRHRDNHHRAEALAAKFPPLLVAAERVAATVAQGVHGRRRVGQGETFWQFRRYQQGDSARRIDWRQSAKSQPVYIRETEWAAAESVWLWRDASFSMDYRSSTKLPSKAERAKLLLPALASLLIRGGEHVALLGSGRPPTAGRAVLNHLAEAMEKVDDMTGLPAFEFLPRQGRIVLIGDFLSPLEEVEAAVSAFAARGVRGHLMQILDPAEETLPFSGRVRFQGMEGEQSVLIPRVESVREDYRRVFAGHHDGLAALARSLGWSFAVHHTDRPPETALLALFMALSVSVRN
ncbi:MAG: hypothetical protein A3G18_05580 [Rhodospirillales bacterium RIFCSPLOWO2_12_FULL_58_28]|nr:MAG: hypothetical protein A3H92_00580 [Rhodospirillales bacterium RIFCSPLOWO2_02_FULL_58_16]OHC79417.1 MAG: hypothetical protein A3G18_05580 [Rhodospirillales bacterium RIFCSPLOWO2_12_FULL_58_28]